MTRPSDRARKAAEEWSGILNHRDSEYEGDPVADLAAEFDAFERETPGFAAGVGTFIEYLASVCEMAGRQAGVGGMETAGGIVSYLAEHPEKLDDFMREGFFGLPALMHRCGRLTWHGMNGKIVSPEYSRRAAQIAAMQDQAK